MHIERTITLYIYVYSIECTKDAVKESYFLVPQFLRKQTISRAPLVLTGLFISYGEYANNANSEVIYKIWHKEVNLKHVVWKTYVICFLSSSIAEDCPF